MTNVSCSDKFPNTSVFYQAIADDVVSIVFLSIACILTAGCIGIFIEELIFLQRVHYGNEWKIGKISTILGLYPVTIVTSLICLLVPTSTILLELIASCYLSVCFYTFVTLTIDYFGGEDRMIDIMADYPYRLSTPPCCCCCCCILKPIKLSKKALLYLKLCSLQVAVVRPVLLFIAAVLWTDGKYTNSMGSSTSYTYITIVTAISTIFSLYGSMVIVRGSRERLKQYYLGLKYSSFQTMLVLINLQNLIFAILAIFDIPGCIGVRGTKVRGSALQHSILIIETFILALVARKAYRIDEADIEGPMSPADAGFGPDDIKADKVISDMTNNTINVDPSEVNITDSETGGVTNTGFTVTEQDKRNEMKESQSDGRTGDMSEMSSGDHEAHTMTRQPGSYDNSGFECMS